MKKWLIALSMCICLLSLTACGSEENVTYLNDSDALADAAYAASYINNIVVNDAVDEAVYQNEAAGMGTAIKNACDSMSKALDEMGALVEVGDLVSNTVETNTLGMPTDGTIQIQLLGTSKNATFEVVYENGQYASFTTNVDYTFGEKMERAGLNTLLGMGTVFVILILISLIISAFNLIPKISALFAKDKDTTANEKAVDSAIAQIVEKEELSDDLELVAVISAAIAQYEGTSSDGFVVRSIRRAR